MERKVQLNKQEIEELIENKIQEAEKKFGKKFKDTLIEIISLEKMIQPEVKAEKKSRLIPLVEWDKYYSYPTIGALYQYHHYRNENGFDEVVEYGGMEGGRILINEDKLFEWIEKRKKKKKSISREEFLS